MSNILNGLVLRQENKVVTTSRLVAEKFNKRHSDVIRALDGLECSNEFRERNFALSSYKSEQNKEMPEYIITRDGFSFLVMGFTGKDAAKFKEEFIGAFNKMETELKSQATQLPTSNEEALLFNMRQHMKLYESAIQQQEQLIAVKQAAYETSVKLSNVEQQVKNIEQRFSDEQPFTIRGFAALKKIHITLPKASGLGKKAIAMCRRRGIEICTIPDPRFGTVNLYPQDILTELFAKFV